MPIISFLKIQVKLLTANNTEIGSIKLHKIVGEYSAAYLHRDVKTSINDLN